MTDYTTLTDAELEAERVAVNAEVDRRFVLATAAQQVDRINADVQSAKGAKDGDEWVQPTGAHDAFPRGAVRIHGGKRYRSNIPANTTEPGTDSRWWTEVDPAVAVGADPNDPKPWVQPVPGLPDKAAYNKGALVSEGGHIYRSLIDGNVWRPGSDPALWEFVR